MMIITYECTFQWQVKVFGIFAKNKKHNEVCHDVIYFKNESSSVLYCIYCFIIENTLTGHDT